MNTQNTVDVTRNWQDISALIPATASVSCLIQCVTDDMLEIVFGGASAPVGKAGLVLGFRDSVTDTSANRWVRAVGDGAAQLSVNLV